MNEQKKGSMPTWLKWILGLAACGIIFIVGSAVAGWMFFKNAIHGPDDTVAVKQVEQVLGTFADPLPDGFKLVNVSDMFGFKKINILHTPEYLFEAWTVVPLTNDKQSQGYRMGFEKGMNVGEENFATIESGTLDVGGRKLEYKMGYRRADPQKKISLEGRVTDVPNKLIYITATTDATLGAANGFDFELFKKSLACVKNFN